MQMKDKECAGVNHFEKQSVYSCICQSWWF